MSKKPSLSKDDILAFLNTKFSKFESKTEKKRTVKQESKKQDDIIKQPAVKQ